MPLDLGGVTPEQLARVPAEDLAMLAAIVELEAKTKAGNRFYRLYPETGPLRRDLYPKHMSFFRAGEFHQERAIIASNRSGKSFAVSYEDVCHLTGEYPEWWIGYRFDRPVTTWLAGEDTKAVRESLQQTLLGPPGAQGTGLVPAKLLLNATPRSGVPEAVDAFTVRHVTGGVSRGVFKTYDQGRESFQASKVDVVVFDEEPPVSIYSEGLTRTMSTVPGQRSGLVMCAFTPLKGLSGLVLSYMPGGERVEGAL